jgi:hypothetical protein
MDNILNTEYDNSLAVIVGVNDYLHSGRLRGAVSDASSVANLLLSEFAFDSQNVFILLDQEATQRNILDHLELVAQTAQPNDRVIFFFAGHGITRRTASGGKIGYVATVASEPNKWNTYLRIEDITRYSGLVVAKHVFYVFDSCFSGLALTRQADVGIQGISTARWIADCMTHKTRQVLTAGLAEQEVGDLTEDGHSVFTSYFLKALSGEAAGSEGEIIASQIMAYVTDKVMKDPRSAQTPAHGDLVGSEPGGDFVFRYPGLTPFIVPAEREGGINTGVLVKPGQRITFSATGVITYDSGHHFANPDGMLCSYKGQPLAHPQALKPMVWQHKEAYKTDDGNMGIIGSLIGWIGEYSEESAFLVGSEREIATDREGFLYLAINDAKGTYADNQGEYRVTVQVS